ncbi:MAG: hypothetical protein WC438_04985 [Candidatus Pacearchaeota archaeon]
MKILMKRKAGKQRAEGKFKIDDVIIKEDIIDLDKTRIAVEISSDKSIGNVEFSRQEIERLVKSIEGKIAKPKIEAVEEESEEIDKKKYKPLRPKKKF